MSTSRTQLEKELNALWREAEEHSRQRVSIDGQLAAARRDEDFDEVLRLRREVARSDDMRESLTERLQDLKLQISRLETTIDAQQRGVDNINADISPPSLNGVDKNQ